MNNIAGFIQPTYSPPNVLGIIQPSSFSSGGSDLTLMVIVSVLVVIVLFVIYKHMKYYSITENEPIVKKSVETFVGPDGLTKCGWQVIVADYCGFCKEQKRILQENYPSFTNFDDSQKAVSTTNGVPTWRRYDNNGWIIDERAGLQSLEKLKLMERC